MYCRIALIGIATFLSACAPLSPLTFSVPNVAVSKRKVDAELRSMTVTIARADERTGDLPAGMEREVPQIWQSSLTEALNRMAIFQDDAPTKVNLSVKILKLAVPGAGAEMTTNTTALYQVVDRKSGLVVFSETVSAAGTAPWDYSFLGTTRSRESLNRSVQNNIKVFLQALEARGTRQIAR